MPMAIEQIQINFVPDAVKVGEASTLPSAGCGAEFLFIGRTRPETHELHGKLTALRYSCYKEMATSELHKLAQEAIDRFSAKFIRITHSVGEVPIGEVSVVIAVSSAHRDDANTACRFLIDLLKQRVPIWKQEMWADGTTWSTGINGKLNLP